MFEKNGIIEKIICKENFLIYDATNKEGRFSCIIENRKTGIQTEIPAGDMKVTEKMVSMVDLEKFRSRTSLTLHIWKVNPEDTEYTVRDFPIPDRAAFQRVPGIEDYKFFDNFVLFEFEVHEFSLYDIRPEIPEKIELPDCADFLTEEERLEPFSQTWLIDHVNEILIKRLQYANEDAHPHLRGIDLIFQVKYPKL